MSEPSPRPALTFKFGGMSIGSAERLQNAARLIRQATRTHRVSVVVSALSLVDKSSGTTNQLLQIGLAAAEGDDVQAAVRRLFNQHDAILQAAITEPGVRRGARDQLARLRETLLHYLYTAKNSHHLSPVQLEQVVGIGEALASTLLAAACRSIGLPANAVDLSDALSVSQIPSHGVDYAPIRDPLAKLITPNWEQDQIPVITGFIGRFPGGLLQRVGRGYSDVTGALVASLTQSEKLVVWKDVDGITTADPQIVPEARVQRHLSPAEALELTRGGSEVLHPDSISLTAEQNIPILVRHAQHPDRAGTMVGELTLAQKSQIKSITVKRALVKLQLNRPAHLAPTRFMTQLFATLEAHNQAAAILSTSETQASLLVRDVADLDDLLQDLAPLGLIAVDRGQAVVTLVGEGLASRFDLASRLYALLAANQMAATILAQGPSQMTLSCVIDETQADEAVRTLHRHFIEVDAASQVLTLFSA